MKNVPDDKTLAARAAACKPHVEAAPETSAQIVAKAQVAFKKPDYAAALALAEKVIEKEPGNEAALRIATLSSCSLHDAKQARAYYVSLNSTDRNYALYWCGKENIVPTAEPEAASGLAARGQGRHHQGRHGAREGRRQDRRASSQTRC